MQRVTHSDVFVTPAPDAAFAPPFWRGDDRIRDAHLSERLGTFLRDADACLDADGREGLEARLAEEPLDAGARTAVVDHLVRQREHTGCALPHVDHLLVERVHSGPDGYGAGRDGLGSQLVLHSLAGAAVNRPWALALAARWRERLGEHPEVFASNDAIVVQGGGDIAEETLADLLCPTGIVELLREELEESGTFGACFRESAARSLLISRGRVGERLPLWMSRLASQRLLGRVQRHEDFPVLIEAWRSCLEEHFDLPRLHGLVDRLADGSLALSWSATRTPSPFAAESGWRQINEYMYADDRSRSRRGSATSPTLVETAVREARLRPLLDPAIVEAFLRRRRRLEDGWGPVSALELRDWLRERRLLRQSEFDALAARIDDDIAEATWWRPLATHPDWIVEVREEAAATRVFAPAPDDPAGSPGEETDALRLEWLAQWLRFEPPSDLAALAGAWPGDRDRLPLDLATLVDDGTLVAGALVEGAPAEAYCDADNHEAMLRMQRSARRPRLEALPAARVPDFLACWQRVGGAADAIDGLEPLRALPAPAELWLEALLPARLGADGTPAVDALLANGAFVLTGAPGAQRRQDLWLVAEDELDLLPGPAPDEDLTRRLAEALPDPRARYDFDAFLAATGDAATAADLLWQGVFAGRIALESLTSLRHGLANGFALPTTAGDAPSGAGPTRRGGLRARIRARVRGVPGRFRLLHPPEAPTDEVERLERARRRARLLVDRWGVLCPGLLRREVPGLRWGDVFRALRLMELAGEVAAGHFLDGLDGPQFASPDAVALLREGLAAPAPSWLDGRDPASPAGLALPLAGLPMPPRRAGAGLVSVAGRVVLVTERGGERLRIDADAPAEDRARAIEALAAAQRARGSGALEVHRIDDGPARASQALTDIERSFEVGRDHRAVLLTARPH